MVVVAVVIVLIVVTIGAVAIINGVAGSIVEAIAKGLGFKTCSECQKRRDWLNSLGGTPKEDNDDDPPLNGV